MTRADRKPAENGPEAPANSRRTILVWVCLVCLLAGLGGGWAGSILLLPPKPIPPAEEFSLVRAINGSVGSQISLDADASWTMTPAGRNETAGVVTSVAVAQGATVNVGTVLYTVNLRPVVIAQGGIPSFESIGQNSRGADVVQLQTMLKTLGFYRGTVSGTAAGSTVSAIRAWQKSLGIAPSGLVQQGDLIYVPSLPSRVSLNQTAIAVGQSVAGSELAVETVSAEPSFQMSVSSSQAQLLTLGTRVTILDGKKAWHAQIGTQTTKAQGLTTVRLVPSSGASICGSECADISLGGATNLQAQVITTPTVHGTVVPSAALTTVNVNNVEVTDSHGASHRVTVVASADGESVVTGIAAGLLVRISTGSQSP
jgi:peptidoglycan hydrolase-like protein with peptidoglycan-binding domain